MLPGSESLAAYAQQKLAQDPRNTSLTIETHFKGYVQLDRLVIDVVDLTPEATFVDGWRVLLSFGEILGTLDEPIELVELRRAGAAVLQVYGEDLRILGNMYAEGLDPLLLVKHFPQAIMDLSGAQIYASTNDDVLGFVGQVQQANHAMSSWLSGTIIR